MARPLRLEFTGALYHVTARGNERHDIFPGNPDDDRVAFLETLSSTCDRFNWICHAYCLMTNHNHLLVETPDANLSKGMRQLNGVFTQYINRTYARIGHLFQGRFKGILVEKESYLLELARYIVLNPVRARIRHNPEDWPWSSYRVTAGIDPEPVFLTTDWLLRAFGQDRQQAMAEYRRFVAEGVGAPSPWLELKNQIYLGSEQFIESAQGLIDRARPLQEIPRKQRRPVAQALSYFAKHDAGRDQAMANAYQTGAYSMQIIAEHFGVSRMTVSRAVKQYSNEDGRNVQCET